MMDYEKKYNEALEDMRVVYPNLKGDAKLAVEHAFPELAESEGERNERMRGRVVESLVCYRGKVYDEGDKEVALLVDEEIAWMKKQKEQKPAWSEKDEKMRNLALDWAETLAGQYSFVGINPTDFRKIISWLKSIRPQPKQEWSVEDEKRYLSCLCRLGTGNPDQPETQNSKWFREHVSPKPHWKPSEEQIESLRWIIDNSRPNTEHETLCSLLDDLLKLK